MRYFNKKWYNTNDNIRLKFEICSEAENFSEEKFIKEYNKSLKKFLETNNYMGEEAKEIFEDIYNGYLHLFPNYFPKYILENVADIRMLALRKVSANNFHTIQEYADKKLRDYNRIMEEYIKQYNKIKNKLSENIERNLNLHDCLITNIIKEKDKLIIELDSSNSFVNIKNIIFDNYEIIEEEMNFINGWCLYEEIYIENEQYELHLLIDVPNENDSKLGYFTIRAKDIIFE